MEASPVPGAPCCGSGNACIFAKALLARAATCELSQRQVIAEGDLLECTSPVARANCATLAAVMHERARFALRLPAPGRPLLHTQSLRLQCGGLIALRQALAVSGSDVHRTVRAAQERPGSLSELPWTSIVAAIAAWQPRRRASPRR